LHSSIGTIGPIIYQGPTAHTTLVEAKFGASWLVSLEHIYIVFV